MPVPSGSSPSLGLDDVKRQLDVETGSNDVELAWYLTVATEWVTKKVGDITPTPVQHAILEVVRHLYDTQRGPGATPLADDADTPGGPFDFLTVPRVRELLGPYLPRPTPDGSFPPALAWPDRIEWV